ncbi:hypothetical protein CEXT_421911 [Caerostris extrusa]|uniref:Uncharacterized protein n=1 Tax=Caerostris extrusa TaxID=172846 RepID=A0AAV4X4X0_CAEEX|nr:hypothetical protein CEXT_421911 [Caerostris extrusa]
MAVCAFPATITVTASRKSLRRKKSAAIFFKDSMKRINQSIIAVLPKAQRHYLSIQEQWLQNLSTQSQPNISHSISLTLLGKCSPASHGRKRPKESPSLGVENLVTRYPQRMGLIEPPGHTDIKGLGLQVDALAEFTDI